MDKYLIVRDEDTRYLVLSSRWTVAPKWSADVAAASRFDSAEDAQDYIVALRKHGHAVSDAYVVGAPVAA